MGFNGTYTDDGAEFEAMTACDVSASCSGLDPFAFGRSPEIEDRKNVRRLRTRAEGVKHGSPVAAAERETRDENSKPRKGRGPRSHDRSGCPGATAFNDNRKRLRAAVSAGNPGRMKTRANERFRALCDGLDDRRHCRGLGRHGVARRDIDLGLGAADVAGK
jgi:hypothetical protein